jgi:hypothetical protein
LRFRIEISLPIISPHSKNKIESFTISPEKLHKTLKINEILLTQLSKLTGQNCRITQVENTEFAMLQVSISTTRGCSLKDCKPDSQTEKKIEDTSPQKQAGFKQLDLTIAYRALIQAFVQSDEIIISEIETKKHDGNVYDNS